MKTLLHITTLLVLGALNAAASTEENIHESRPAKAGGTIVVDVDFGSIDLAPGDNDKVVVDAHRKIEASSKEKEEEYLRKAPVTITTEGDKIVVRATRKHDSLGRQLWDLLGHHSTEGKYTIRVPANFNADLDTSGGDIETKGLTGSVKSDTSGGELTFEHIRGDIHADTSGGNIKVANCEGTAGLDTSGGKIEVTDGRGNLKADTSGGGITVLNLAGDAKVETSGGKLRLANISGNLHGETSGGAISAILPATIGGDISLETSAGAITVVTPRNAGLTIDAETSAGRVHSDLAMENVHSDDDSLKATLNGGGHKLVLRSGGGTIEIVSADKETAQQ